MAAPPRFRAFSREAFPNAPAWFEPFLLAFNEVLGQISTALDGRLTRRENLLAGTKVLEFRTAEVVGNTFPIGVKLPGFPITPTLVTLGKIETVESDATPITSAVSIVWRANATGFELTYVSGLTAQTKYRLTLAYE